MAHDTFGRVARARWRRAVALAPVAAAATLMAPSAGAQWSTTYEQFYLNAPYNWEFRDRYPSAAGLFNAFDYGHATLYETLLSEPNAPVSQLEQKEYDFLTKQVLVRPPRLPIEEGAIEVAYVKLAPEVKAMFDWAHTFHRQVYDVWADESIPLAEKDARITELLNYYRSRRDLAFSSLPKSMEIMDGQFYSLAFREKYPKFNGLIWAYHWLQVGLYEPLMTGQDAAERSRLVDATVARFWQMLTSPPASMPYLMPMTPAVSPAFARRYPNAGAIFDNLHMMHDVVADILVSREVPRSAKRQEILRAAALFRSDTAYAVPYEAWLAMGETMGANNMGGPAVGFEAALPTPTVARGASMAGMQHAGMAGMQPGPGAAGMQHGDMPGMPGMAGMQPGMNQQTLQAIFERMMADPVIRERVATDPTLQRMLAGMPGMQGMSGMQPGNTPGMQGMQHGNTPGMAGMQHGNMPGMAGMNADSAAPMTEERRQAVEFLVRLFSDPSVEARIHADPELHRLWSDPDVQRRLAELRRAQPAQPGRPGQQAAPRPPQTPPPHRHP